MRTCGGFFDAGSKQRQLDELQKQITEPNFWSDQERSSKVLRQSARLQETLNLDRQITSQLADLEALVELAREGEPVGDEFVSSLNQHETFVDRVETKVLLSGENDQLNAIVNIHPGAGGTESQDWAEMLMRMYLRWAEQNGFKTQVLDYQEGEQAGIKSVTLGANSDQSCGCPVSSAHRFARPPMTRSASWACPCW